MRSRETSPSRTLLKIFVLSVICFLSQFTPAEADAKGDKLRAILKNVKSVAIVPGFIGTELLSKYEESKHRKEQGTKEPGDLKIEPKLEEYVEALKKIEIEFRKTLPERLASRTRFEISSPDEVASALKRLDLSPGKLFIKEGRIKNKKFPLEDPQNLKRLFETLKTDALLLSMIDEPRRNSEHYYFEPLSGLNFRPSNAQVKICFWLVLPDGKSALTLPVESLHPVSRIGKREFLLADWIEAEELCIENFLDELTLYLPEKPKK